MDHSARPIMDGPPTHTRSQDVRPSRGPRPSRRVLRYDVSRQTLAEFRSHNFRRVLVGGRSAVARLHGPFLPRLEFHSPRARNTHLRVWRVVFLRSAAVELTDRTPGMMTLISLAIIAAFVTSLAATFGIFEIDVW